MAVAALPVPEAESTAREDVWSRKPESARRLATFLRRVAKQQYEEAVAQAATARRMAADDRERRERLGLRQHDHDDSASIAAVKEGIA